MLEDALTQAFFGFFKAHLGGNVGAAASGDVESLFTKTIRFRPRVYILRLLSTTTIVQQNHTALFVPDYDGYTR